ncbi:MAG: hypothetical protein WCH40_03075 [Verrucomicrobiales bacterium]
MMHPVATRPLLAVLLVSVAMGILHGKEPSMDPEPPIEIPLVMEKDGYVTLVIEDDTGTRVRNLVSETFYKAGKHALSWDGMDDHGQADVGPHGNYTMTGSIVAPGTYRVRGITRDKVDLVYEFSVYNPTNPVWRRADTSGQWLSDHTPPSSVLYVPGSHSGSDPVMLIGSSMVEGAHGLVWTDLNGKKLRGVASIGATYAGATRLALDKADQSHPFIAYGLASSVDGDIQLVGIGQKANALLFSRKEEVPYDTNSSNKKERIPNRPVFGGHYIVSYPIGGLAIHNGLAAISFPKKNEIIFLKIDPKATAKEPCATVRIDNPRGMVFDAQGRLLVLSGNTLISTKAVVDADNRVELKDPTTLVSTGLEDPQEIAVAGGGNLYISDHGSSHQVKVFDAQGKSLFAIGKKGKPACGPYDEMHMHYPMGMSLTPSGELWVAEEDFQPKRVSIWTTDGTFKKAFYGPTEYGGGGTIDPKDKSRFYYYGMEFKLDWEAGSDKIVNVFFRRDNPDNQLAPGTKDYPCDNPQTPMYLNGRQYMTTTYGYHTMGPQIAGIYLMENGIAKPVAALGQANSWDIFKGEEYKDKIPAGININAPMKGWDVKPPYKDVLVFAWSDLNNDHKIQPDEVTFAPGKVGGLCQDNGLTFHTGDGLEIKPTEFTSAGTPVYDVATAKRTCPLGLPLPYTVVVPGRNGDFAVPGYAECVSPGKCYGSVSGITKDGKHWYYPNQWTGLHASQNYPVNRTPKPGELIGTTKVIGPSFTVADGKEELWALNANSGQIYLFTIDGFFVSSLFKHGYFCKPNPPLAERGMLMNDLTSDGEGFYQTITAASDGNVYVQAMNHTSSIVRVDGLNSIKRLPDQQVTVTTKQLDECLAWFSKAEIARQLKEGKKEAQVAIINKAPVVDGDLADWRGAEWLEIDSRTSAALMIAEGKLYAAWRTSHEDVIKNSGADPWQAMFKSGGALDVMLSSTGNTTLGPKPGDQRILISKVDGRLRALHYEQKSNRKGHPAAILSPGQKVEFDHIADVSDQIQLAEGRVKMLFSSDYRVLNQPMRMASGTSYEVAIPLALLELDPAPGAIRGDLGVLLGNGSTTIKRLSWSNKNTAMLFDAPTESLLQPALWGRLTLVDRRSGSFARSLQDRGDKVEVLSGVKGGLEIDSAKVKSGEACASIDWSGGKGGVANRAVGSGGYIIFRHQATGWGDADEPHVNLGAGLTFTTLSRGRTNNSKDCFYVSTRLRDLQMSIDGTNCGPKGFLGGGLWSGQKAPQIASWDLTVLDDKTHQMTLILGNIAKEKLTLSPLDKPEQKRELVSFDGDDGMGVVQFSFSGNVRLTLEQPPYTDEEYKANRIQANITAIFVD